MSRMERTEAKELLTTLLWPRVGSPFSFQLHFHHLHNPSGVTTPLSALRKTVVELESIKLSFEGCLEHHFVSL